MDLKELREPIEVYEAAAGNTEPLALRIESGAVMHDWEREALVAYLRGELVPPKRGRGQQTLPHLTQGTKQALEQLRIENAVVLLRHIMKILKADGEKYKIFDKAIAHVVEHRALTGEEQERVVNRYRRSKASKVDGVADLKWGIVIPYQQWLLRTGRLPEYPQRVGFLERSAILKGQPQPPEEN